MATLPDPASAREEQKDQASKDALAQKMEQYKAREKEIEQAAANAKKEENRKKRRIKVKKKAELCKKSEVMFRSAMRAANEVVKHVRGISKEEVVKSIQEKAFMRSLPAVEQRDLIQLRFRAMNDAATEWQEAIDEYQELEEVPTEDIEVVSIDCGKEDAEVLDYVSTLDLLIGAKREYNEGLGLRNLVGGVKEASSAGKVTPLKIKVSTPQFSGKYRDFAIFKKKFQDYIIPGRTDTEIGILLREGLAKKEEDLLRNNALSDYTQALEILQKNCGQAHLVMNAVIAEIDALKSPAGGKADRDFVNFVIKLENIVSDMKEVNLSNGMENAHMIGLLVKKLPHVVSMDWLEHESKEGVNDMDDVDTMKEFMKFLKRKKDMTEKWLSGQGVDKSKTQFSVVTGQCFVARHLEDPGGRSKNPGSGRKMKPFCVACSGSQNPQDGEHWATECAKWKALKLFERKRLVQCIKHMNVKPGAQHSPEQCKGQVMFGAYNNGVKGQDCGICKKRGHCAELCDANRSITKLHRTVTLHSKDAMLPVMLQANYVHYDDQRRLGTLWDLCSTDNYITHAKAEELHLEGLPTQLCIEGVAGVVTMVETKIYEVPVRRKKKKRGYTVFQCYGLDIIAGPAINPDEVSYRKLCDKFGVDYDEMRRPEEIDLLISMRNNTDHPKAAKTKDKMMLFDGPFGKVFGGSEGSLDFKPHVMSAMVRSRQMGCQYTATFRAIVKAVTAVNSVRDDTKLLDYFEEDAIGVDANPKCGMCQCGRCIVGDKPMSLHMEKMSRKFRENLTYKPDGVGEDVGPFFETKYEWDIPKEDLVPNFAAVEATRLRTVKRLEKDPAWHDMYELQLRTLVEKGYARELEEGELDTWITAGNAWYYMAHQMVVDTSNKTTPVRVVFNTSQKFRGFSLNTCWNLGPDMMSNLQAILLRFRDDVEGAQGDISKMFYMVRVNKEEEFMQLFIWKFKGEDRLRTFTMTCLVMGNKPSTNISIVAVQETTELEDFKTRLPEACKTLTDEIYVDNVFITAKNKELLLRRISEVEQVAAKGGFKFKPWMIARGLESEDEIVSFNGYEEVEKALGLYWCLKEDKFFVKLELNEEDMKLLKNLGMDLPVLADTSGTGPAPLDVYRDGLPGHSARDVLVAPVRQKLTLRICLKFHMRIFDPLGFVLPTKMIGNLLFRTTIQVIKKEGKGRLPWDEGLPDSLVSDWFRYFGLLLQLESIKFPRSFKPENTDPEIPPDLITFEDGNPDAFGCVAYALWTMIDGSREARLIMAKAKLSPIVKKGETVRSELNGATFAARMQNWIKKNCDVGFRKHIPFLDSQIVRDMIRKDSYWFNTFAGMRIAEIQTKTDVESWRHIPSNENIADVLTRGAMPSTLGEASLWQRGPSWLTKSEDTWPVSEGRLTSTEIDREVKDFLTLDKKLRSAAFGKDDEIVDKPETTLGKEPLTISSCTMAAKRTEAQIEGEINRGLDGDMIDKLIMKYSDLSKLIRIVAYLMRWALATRRRRGTSCGGRTRSDDLEITAPEYDDAWLVLIHHEQNKNLVENKIKKLVPKKTVVKLSLYDWNLDIWVIGGRVTNFPVGYSDRREIPIIPYGPFGKLLMLHYHDEVHRDIDTVVAVARADVWVVQARRLASHWDNRCKICKLKRRQMAGQQMGDLPSFRTEIRPPWTSVNMDLFGPYLIRDDCVKKGPRIYKKVWGVIYTCTLTRGVYLDVATDYGTTAVLHTVRRLMAQKGEVKLLISDPGTQLKGASKEIATWRKDWKQEELVRFGAAKGLEWRCIMAASQRASERCC